MVCQQLLVFHLIIFLTPISSSPHNQEVCGAVPKSRMFCEPVRRPRPQTSAFILPPAGPQSMSVVTCAVSTSTCGDPSAPSLVGETRDRPATVTAEPVASGATAGATAYHPPPSCTKCSPRRQRTGCRGGHIVRRPEAKLGAGGRHRSERRPPPASTARAGRVRPPTVGPSSFPRAERPTITDEYRQKEESYGKKAVRLLTREGDVLVTVTRRRESAWGSQGPPLGLGPDCTGAAAAAAASTTSRAAAERRSTAQERKKPTFDEQHRPAVGNHRGSPGSRKRADGGGHEGGSAVSGTSSVRARPVGYASVKRGSTLEAQAMRLLPDDLASSLTAYREPGRAELPLVFRATSAPIVAAAPNSRAVKNVPRRSAGRADPRGTPMGPDCGGGGGHGATPAAEGVGEWSREKEEQAHVARIVRAAEDLVANSGGGGGGGDGIGGGGQKSSFTTRLPATSDPDFSSSVPGGVGAEEEMARAETTDGSCDFVSSTIWSGGATSATMV